MCVCLKKGIGGKKLSGGVSVMEVFFYFYIGYLMLNGGVFGLNKLLIWSVKYTYSRGYRF